MPKSTLSPQYLEKYWGKRPRCPQPIKSMPMLAVTGGGSVSEFGTLLAFSHTIIY